MKKRTFIFDTSEGAGEALSKVLLQYTETAYPKGGSDCAAASREALLSIVNKIEGDEYCEISTRQRPILNAAVKWYYQESCEKVGNEIDSAEFELLLSLLQKKKEWKHKSIDSVLLDFLLQQSVVERITVPSGVIISRQGDVCENLVIVLEGQVKVYRPAENGRSLTLYYVENNES